MLVFLGTARPELESRDVFFRSPVPPTELVLGLERAAGLSLLFCRDLVSLVCFGLFLFLFRGSVPYGDWILVERPSVEVGRPLGSPDTLSEICES